MQRHLLTESTGRSRRYVDNDRLNGADPKGACNTGTRIRGGNSSGCKILGFSQRERTAEKSGEVADFPTQADYRFENESGSSISNSLEPEFEVNEDSIDAKIKVLTVRGDLNGLKSLLEAANPQQARLISSGIQRLESRAADVIAKELKGSVNREFPTHLRDKSVAEIYRLAREGDSAAQTARKLLTESRFKKGN
ncbi:MAG: hypothetical protein AMXMBFR37_09670 [Steroidobacteraceae bacterium]